MYVNSLRKNEMQRLARGLQRLCSAGGHVMVAYSINTACLEIIQETEVLTFSFLLLHLKF